MNWITEFIQRHKEGLAYLICGVCTVIVSWLTYSLFVELGTEVNISNILSWLCAVVFAFVVNKWFVFHSTSVERSILAKEISSFFATRTITGIISIICFPILLEIGLNESLLGVDGLPAKITVTVIEVALNYLASKYYIFRSNNKT